MDRYDKIALTMKILLFCDCFLQSYENINKIKVKNLMFCILYIASTDVSFVFYRSGKYDPRRTMRSAERCAKLNCAEDEGCYLRDTVDASGTTVSTTLMCSKKRPCEITQCDDDHYCEDSVTGDQPPIAQCKPYGAETDYDPCKTKQCPDGTMCALRRALCNEKTCIWEPLCAKAQACWDCKLYYQFCEIFGKDGDAVGVCRDFKDRYSGW